MENTTSPFLMLSSSAYNNLKWFTLIGLPALVTAYTAIGEIWHIPHTDLVSQTALVVILLLGTLIGVSTKNYNAQSLADQDPAATEGGTIVIDDTDGETRKISLVLDEALTVDGPIDASSLVFQVENKQPEE